jgi:integrase
MALYKRGGVWWFRFKFAGQSIRESAKTSSKTLAVEAERARRRQMEASYNGVQKRVSPMLFSAATRNWMDTHPDWRPNTRALQRFALQHINPVFERVLISDITADDIARYQMARKSAGASARSINIEVGVIRSILIKHRLWANIGPDVKMLKERQSIGRALLLEEQEALLSQCRASQNRALYPIVEIALNTGLRSDEIRKLRWQQIDFDNSALTVSDSKTLYGERRVVPLNARLTHILQLWAERFPERKPQHFLFPFEMSAAGGQRGTFGFVASRACETDPTLPIGSWKKAWTASCKRAAMKLRFHDLRHSAVTRLLEAGVDLERVARILGWSPRTTQAMARRYGHLSLIRSVPR